LAIVSSLRRQVLLDVLDELVAVASDNELHLGEVVALKDRLPDATAMVVIDGVDRVVKND
jgi:hypothetical protein